MKIITRNQLEIHHKSTRNHPHLRRLTDSTVALVRAVMALSAAWVEELGMAYAPLWGAGW